MVTQRPGLNAEINTTPMADVALQLLIFLMVAALFSATRGLDFAGDSSGFVCPPFEFTPIVHVVVQSSGDVRVDQEPVSMTHLLDVLSAKIASREQRDIVLEVEANAKYGDMIAAYDLILQARLRFAHARHPGIYVPTLREAESIL